MNPLKATWICLSKSFQFSGRASRDEFWGFFVVLLVFRAIVGPALDLVIFGHNVRAQPGYALVSDTTMLLVAPAVASAAMRRMHDTGRKGWLIFIPYPFAWAVLYATLALGPSTLAPTNTFITGPGNTAPTAILVEVSLLPTWLVLSLWALSVAGFVLSFVWLARKSQPIPNRYGPPPPEVKP